MKLGKKILLSTCVLAVSGFMYGCGTEEPGLFSTTVTGEIQQGPIQNAYVFLDLDGNGVRDQGEPSTLDNADPTKQFTDASGKYSLTIPASAATKINAKTKISVGYTANSVDTITGSKPTAILVSNPPAGIGTVPAAPTTFVTPITTLVAYAPDPAALTSKLASIGMPNPNSTLATTTPAVLALAKSTEVALAASQGLVNGANAAGAIALGQSVAGSIASKVSTAPLTTPTQVASAVSNGVSAAIAGASSTILSGTGSVDTTTLATTIGAQVQTVAAIVTGNNAGATFNNTQTVTEATAFSAPAAINTINNAVDNTKTAISDSGVTVIVDTSAPSVVFTNSSVTTTDLTPVLNVQFNKNVTGVDTTNVVLTIAGTATVVPGSVTYDPTSFIATYTPNNALTAGVTYTLTLKTGIANAVTNGKPLASAVTLTLIEAASATGATGSGSGSLGGTGINF